MTLTRKPSSVGTILKEEFFGPGNLDSREFALACKIPNPATVEWLLSDAIFFRRVHAERLADGTNTTPEFWMNINKGWRQWHVDFIKSQIGEGPYPDWAHYVYLWEGSIIISDGPPGGHNRWETLKENLADAGGTSLNLAFMLVDGKVVP